MARKKIEGGVKLGAAAGHRRDMKYTARLLAGLLPACLFTVATGCTSNAVVGTEHDSPPGGACEGVCPTPLFADEIANGWSEVLDMAPTPDGDMVLVGRFSGTLEVPGGSVDDSGYSGNDMFLMKVSPGGDLVWANRMKGNMPEVRIAVRPDGEIVVVGCFQGPAELNGFGPYIPIGLVDSFLQNVRADGTAEVPRVYAGDIYVRDLALAPNGDALVAGMFNTIAQLGDVDLTPAEMGGVESWRYDGVVVRLSPSGDVVFARSTGATGDDQLGDIVALPDGGMVLTGEHPAAFSFDGVSFPGGGAYLLALDAAGHAVRGSPIEPPAAPEGASEEASSMLLGVERAPDGRLFMLIQSWWGDDLGARVVLRTLDGSGTQLGEVDLGIEVNNPVDPMAAVLGISDLAVAQNGDLLVGGPFRGILNIGGVEVEGPLEYHRDGYLARITSTGELRWVQSFGAPEELEDVRHVGQPRHVGFTSAGIPFLAGEYQGGLSIGEFDLPYRDGPHAFMAAFAE
jgi:hypothetical protein